MPIGLRILNTSSKSSTSKKQCHKKVAESVQMLDSKRIVLEQARKERVKRIHKDLEGILQREQEYTKEVIEKVLPIKIIWNESLLETLSSLVPFRIEKIEKIIEPEVVSSMEEEVMDEVV